MATLFVPPRLRDLTGGERHITVSSASVRGLIDELEQAHPGFRDSLVDGDSLRPGLAIAIDGVSTPDGLLAKIPANAEIHILPAIAGGAAKRIASE